MRDPTALPIRTLETIDGNEAAARVAHALSEVIAIYPITPASPMGELSDAWSAAGQKNLWGVVPEVVEMQSEGGAAGAVHGALQAGALSTTFTASQGLLLMIPNMFKIAGELTPLVIHVAARSIATHALSIFGDHSDVMSARSTGFAMLCSESPQEAQDFALIAHSATLQSRIPFMHFFDGFRTSHELNQVEIIGPEIMRALIPDSLIQAHRARAMNPDAPTLRGTAQNPDVFFQAREASNSFYREAPQIVADVMALFAELTGRRYELFEYSGAPDAERVVVMMGSGASAAEEAVRILTARGEKVGLLRVRLYRPLDEAALLAALPLTVKRIAVLDRTKEPGAPGEPLYLDVVATLARSSRPRVEVYGGRYGLSSKEVTPKMLRGVFDELAREAPRHGFTVGIVDDLTHTSLPWDRTPEREPDDVFRAVFFGLGSDGTVGANKNTVKIVGEHTALSSQGYFVYDSKKAGATTVSHLRFSPRPIRASYLVQEAQLVACHQFSFLESTDVLALAGEGATVLLESPYGPEETWAHIPKEAQAELIAKRLKLWVVDAHQVASDAGLGRRINTVMQACFFALTDLMPRDKAFEAMREAVRKTYGKRGRAVVERNLTAIDGAIAALHPVKLPAEADGWRKRRPMVPSGATSFVERVTSMVMAGRGDLLPVSAFPVDGAFPTGTARFEKRSIALELPIWDPDICIQCGLCPLVCPHAAIRTKAYPVDPAVDLPSLAWKGKEQDGLRLTIQVAPDDCTGCGVCADVCPARSKEVAKHKALDMRPKHDHLEVERARFDSFLALPELSRPSLDLATIKGSQLAEPLFEFSGACAGCGETPYLKLLTQLYGDRMVVANATGCSSIYGGNLPTTPWSKNAEGRGPAWSNSLFEDNAELGLGMRLAIDAQEALARTLLAELAPQLGGQLCTAILEARPSDEAGLAEQRARMAQLDMALRGLSDPQAQNLRAVAHSLVPRSVWIVGGDGWAYDIGFGGVDHVLASGRNVNIIVLDTEVYSNTGGQASKATPRAAVAKFAAAGKTVGKKDLGMIAMAYGNVYVAQIAVGASPLQTLKALREAESYPGTSLVIAYSTCIAHGIDMTTSMSHQKEATTSGYWPLYRYDPRLAEGKVHPFHLDSKRPVLTFEAFAAKEARFAMLKRSDPARAARLFALAQKDIDERWRYYEQLAKVERRPNEAMERES